MDEKQKKIVGEIGGLLVQLGEKVSELAGIDGAQDASSTSESLPGERGSGIRIKLKIIFPDGVTIYDRVVVNTFRRAIEKIGVDKVARLDIRIGHNPLIGDRRVSGKGRSHRLSDGRYLFTGSSTASKGNQLREIADRLNIPLKVKEVEVSVL